VDNPIFWAVLMAMGQGFDFAFFQTPLSSLRKMFIPTGPTPLNSFRLFSRSRGSLAFS